MVVVGQIYESKKMPGLYGEVLAISEDNKVTVKAGDETREVTESVLNRWWKLTDKVATPVDNIPEPPQVAPENVEDNVVGQKVGQDTDAPINGDNVDNNIAPNGKKRGELPVDPLIQKLHDKFVAYATDELHLVTKEVGNYLGVYVGKRNICEIHLQKRSLKLHFNADSLTDEVKEICKVVPETYGWTLDAVYKVTSDPQLKEAFTMLRLGMKFRAGVIIEDRPLADKKNKNKK